MKHNIEHKIHEVFDSYELPYNPDSWTRLSGRLDLISGASPSASRKLRTRKRWTWAGVSTALAILTAVGVYYTDFATTTNTFELEKEGRQTDAINKTENHAYTQDSDKVKSLSENPSLENKNKTLSIGSQPSHSDEGLSSGFLVDGGDPLTPSDLSIILTEKDNLSDDNTSISHPVLSELDASNFSHRPAWLPNELCQGDVLSIEHIEKNSLFLLSPSKKRTEIKGKLRYPIEEPGRYYLLSSRNPTEKELEQADFFEVKENPQVDFTVDMENPYKEGIPTILLQTHVEGRLIWHLDKHVAPQYGQSAEAHFYKKGNYNISLTVHNENGCSSTTTKNVAISKDYNLLAPTAFVPLSSDSRTNRFIPVALLHRNTHFLMQIIDPQRGIVIYQSTTTEGWDGIDRTTNQLVKENSSFIWKVTLTHPQPGESSEYKGFITRL